MKWHDMKWQEGRAVASFDRYLPTLMSNLRLNFDITSTTDNVSLSWWGSGLREVATEQTEIHPFRKAAEARAEELTKSFERKWLTRWLERLEEEAGRVRGILAAMDSAG